ncbi:MAG: deoxyribose-phosphate aldolase [Planctomycetota bacterium]|nr:MAG: deoxyribose-phosphate aldolase [Planctomycetota bacterium]
MARDGGGAGAPFCAVCETPGQCARQCSDQAEGIRQLGAARISGAPGIGPLDELIARSIDHTLLKPDATKEQITYLCAEAAKYGFASVCVNPFWVPYCAELLRGHPVAVCTVVGFPLGANPSEVKAHEARWAVEHGATEIDMVINIGALKSGLLDVVEEDIRAVKQACGRHVLKVILETALLDDHEKVAACEASMRAGADYVKTSTGFSTGGATAGDVALMRRVVGERAGVKASGGVRTKRDAALMLASGASRIGASAGVKILQEVPGLSGGVAKIARPAGGDAY